MSQEINQARFSSRLSSIRVAFCQIDSSLGNVERNVAAVNKLISDIEPGSLDILMLPEMVFSGYSFESADHIEPFLEPTSQSKTILWCSEVASRLQCWVTAGFPQKDESTGSAYNAMCMVSRAGELVHVYRKHFLFMTDETWATPGPSFQICRDARVTAEFGIVGFGICMDLNPYKFEADYELREFANFHKDMNTQLILCAMAWMTCPGEKLGENRTVEYWLDRLWPLAATGSTVLIANRVGAEGANQFVGDSSVFVFSSEATRISRTDAREGLYRLEFNTNPTKPHA